MFQLFVNFFQTIGKTLQFTYLQFSVGEAFDRSTHELLVGLLKLNAGGAELSEDELDGPSEPLPHETCDLPDWQDIFDQETNQKFMWTTISAASDF